MDINDVTLLGRVGKDPEFFKMSNGDEIAKIRLATSYNFFDKQTQQYIDRTSWHNVVVYPQLLVKIAKERVNKGAVIYVKGSIKYKEYKGNDGILRQSTDIEVAPGGGVMKLVEKPKTQNTVTEYTPQNVNHNAPQNSHEYNQPRKVEYIEEYDPFEMEGEGIPF